VVARPTTLIRRLVAGISALSLLAVNSCSSGLFESAALQPNQVAAVCGNPPLGPTSAPRGAVIVDPAVVGDLMTKTEANPPGTTFWLAPARYTLGANEFDQIKAKNGNKYIGAPGAILDGNGINRYAVAGNSTNVVIRYLTIRGFVPPVQQGVINSNSSDSWTIERNIIEDNQGAALMAGTHQVVRGNCLRNNGQYAINAAKDNKEIGDLLVEGNEITGNNADDTESKIEDCGCSGGAKFWRVNGAEIRGNWIHGNHGPGLWVDTNNNDFLIEKNVLDDNDGAAIIYETSYNAIIRNNIIRRNNWVEGQKTTAKGDGFPAATIYISESGGEPRIPARTSKIEIYSNILQDNWSGITLWENSDRYCNSPANTSTGVCTLLVPRVSRCIQPGIAIQPLYSDCRWKTQRVDIHDNRFSVAPDTVGCRAQCAVMAVLSNFGIQPNWSPYRGDAIQRAIVLHQQNYWRNNDYAGPWAFMAIATPEHINRDQWQSAPYLQDYGSTFSP